MVDPKGQISNTLQSDLKRLVSFIYKFSSRPNLVDTNGKLYKLKHLKY